MRAAPSQVPEPKTWAAARRLAMLLATAIVLAGAPALAQPRADAAASQGTLPAEIPVKRDGADRPADGQGPGWPHAAALVVAAVLLVMCVPAWRRARARGALTGGWLKAGSAGCAGGEVGPLRTSSLYLSPRHTVHELHWNGRRLLVGCSEQAMQLLAEAPLPDHAATTPVQTEAGEGR